MRGELINMDRIIKYYQAIQEAIDQSMGRDPAVYIIGEGVTDPKGIFGTTLNLARKYGKNRVMDMPVSENGMTGVAIGSAMVGMRPIMTHQRFDFVLMAMDQIINSAAKWHYMFNGQICIPLVIRLVIGRGWGQGPQHSQSLQALFAHIPGLKIVMPSTPYDAKGLLISSIEDNNPVIFIEHRWLHNTLSNVPSEIYRVPLGQARLVRKGKDITIAATSYMVLEALQAADILKKAKVEVEIIDIRTIRPLDKESLIKSVKKTGRLIVADTGWKMCGLGSEVITCVVEEAFHALKCPPQRLGSSDYPAPTSPALTEDYYPLAADIVSVAGEMLGISREFLKGFEKINPIPLDVPDSRFTGPF